MPTTPRISLVDATPALFDAALTGRAALVHALGAEVAEGWEGFPEALPMLSALCAEDPSSGWGSVFFVLTEPRTLVGLGGYKGPPSEGVVEIGYSIAPAFQGVGLATEAARALVVRAFEEPEVRAVEAHTLAHNNASGRVLSKCGFTRVGEAHDVQLGAIWHWLRTR
jgi:[ribosomal protein S5]-alanine N-acetyltransferase